jgi:formylmethanofuran dehydrogenase subunit E
MAKKKLRCEKCRREITGKDRALVFGECICNDCFKKRIIKNKK